MCYILRVLGECLLLLSLQGKASETPVESRGMASDYNMLSSR